MKAGLIFLIIFCLLLVWACERNSTNTNTAGKVVRPDTTNSILANIGDTIEIKILNNSWDGGYTWKKINDFDSTVAKFISYRSIYTGTGGITGAPTYEIWDYYAIKEGNSQLSMKLDRVFENNSTISNKSYNLNIKKMD